MENESINMIAVDTVTTTGAEDTATQKKPSALVKKIGKITTQRTRTLKSLTLFLCGYLEKPQNL